jgi:hypothetical protein
MTAGIRINTLDADVVRMDDDGGGQIVPGQRDGGTLTRFRPAVSPSAVPPGAGSMDAATIADRRREGGGSPRARRSMKRRSLWELLGSWRSR